MYVHIYIYVCIHALFTQCIHTLLLTKQLIYSGIHALADLFMHVALEAHSAPVEQLASEIVKTFALLSSGLN